MYELPANEVKWVERMLKYNVTGGKMNRGLMVVESVEELAKVRQSTCIHQTHVNIQTLLSYCVSSRVRI